MTIRTRITIVAAVTVVAVLVVGAVALVLVQRQLLLAGVDAALVQQAADVAALLDTGSDPTDVAAVSEDDDGLIQLVTPAGHVLAGTAGADAAPIADPVQQPVTRTLDVPVDDDPFRVRSTPVTIDGTAAVLHVGVESDAVGEAGSALTTALLVAVPATVAVLSAIIWVLVGRTLRPVADIQAEVAMITAADLDRRVPEPAVDDEIGRLARLVNGMLDRLEAASVRQRRFTGDAAHELRTPLARLRTELEVDLAHPDTADPTATHRSALEEVEDMQTLVEDLLLLARVEDVGTAARHSPAHIADLLADAATATRPGVAVRVDADPALEVEVDRRALTRALRNLIDNAVRYADTAVHVNARRVGDEVEVVVADDGAGIPAEQHDTIFERFTRLDDARSPVDGGTGLGLAITREIITAHRGTVRMDPAATRGTRMLIRFPRRPSPRT